MDPRSLFNTCLRGKIAHPFKCLDELRAAIRIARIIKRIHADKDIVRFQNLGPRQREGKKNRIARRYVGDRDSTVHRCLIAPFRYLYIAGEGGVAEHAKVDLRDLVIHCAERVRDLRARRPVRRDAAGRSRRRAHNRQILRGGHRRDKWRNRVPH